MSTAASTLPTDAVRFLHALDPRPDATFTFQTFDDAKSKRPSLVRILHGTLEEHSAVLDALNEGGAGIFVCVNETDQLGRKTQNVVRIRVAFLDLDNGSLSAVLASCLASHVVPHIVVETSPGKFHCFWRLQNCPLAQWAALQKALAKRFGGDPSVHDLPRVARLPGYLHQKDASRPFRSQIFSIVEPPE